MSSSPLGTELDHPFRRFESRNSISLDKNVHFFEPHSPKTHRSDPLNLKIEKVLGPFSQVSPHLLSEIRDSPDYLFGVETYSSSNNSPKHHRQRPPSTEQKIERMIGQNSRPTSGQRPNQMIKRKPQQISENKPRPTNHHPMHNPGKHGSRAFLPSPNPSSNPQPHKSNVNVINRKARYDSVVNQPDCSMDIKMKKPMSNTLSFPKRPDKVKKEEHINPRKLVHSDINSNRPVNGENHDFYQKTPPKEELKTATVIPERVLKPPSDKSRPPTNMNSGEITPKRNQIPNLDLSLERPSLYDDSFQELFAGMEPLPTPLTEIQTPVGNKQFLAFPSNHSTISRDLSQRKDTHPVRPAPRDTHTNRPMEQDSSESDSSDSESEHEQTESGRTKESSLNRQGNNFLDIEVSSDSESSDSSPVQVPTYPDRENIFASSPKRLGTIPEPAPLQNNSGWNSSPSSDNSNTDVNSNTWNKPSTTHKTEFSSWVSHRSPPPPPRLTTIPEPVIHTKTATTRNRKMSQDSDSVSPDRKRFKISISLDKVEVPNKVKPLIVSFPRCKISLSGDKPLESNKQMARVQPIQRHLPDSGKDMTIAQPTYSCLPRVAEVQPQQKISRKSPRNMTSSPDTSWQGSSWYEPQPPIVPPTQSSAGEIWGTGSHADISYPTKMTRLSTSHDYLTEAKDLKHQADKKASSYKKALFYCEAALSFMLYGDQLEATGKTDAISTYSETFDLLDFVLRPTSSNKGGLGFSKQCPQLITLCLRCQAVIHNRIFVIKLEALRNTHRELHEFFSAYKSDTKAKTPLSNKSPFSSSWSPTMVQVPQRIATMNSDYLQVLEYQFNSMELWSKSQLYEDDTLPFIQKLNTSVGKSVDMYSSIKDTTTWCKVGLQWLKRDQT